MEPLLSEHLLTKHSIYWTSWDSQKLVWYLYIKYMASSSLLSFDINVPGKKCKRKVVSIERKLEICHKHKMGQSYTSLSKEYCIALNFRGRKLSWFLWLMESWKFFSQIFSHTRQEWINAGIIMKYSLLHESFITKYLFWNKIQEITKVWSYTVWPWKSTIHDTVQSEDRLIEHALEIQHASGPKKHY